MGMEEVKTELEDLCFRFLLPDEYETLADRMKRSRNMHREVMNRTVEMLDNEFKKQHVEATVIGRQRNLYGIYKKVAAKTRRIDEFDNLIAIRVIARDRGECYKVLGIIHSLFKPRPGKFKDYIAVPKINGYRSLHTTVFGLDGVGTEVQIRTDQMNLEAEYGVAAQYFLTGLRDKKHLLEEDGHAVWMKKIMQMQKLQEQDREFMDDLRRDVLHDRIFVFTPKGQSIDLPQGATCIDFAYQIHTQVGHCALKADINGEIMPMATALQNGDTVRIITSDAPKGPDHSWLPFTKTSTARKWIRDYFKKTTHENKIGTGRTLLQKELDRAGLGLLKDIPQKKIKSFCEYDGNYGNVDEILAAIGEGTLRPFDFVNKLYSQKSATLGFLKWLEFPIKKKHSPPYTPVSIKIVGRESIGQMEKILKTILALHINIIRTKAYVSFWSGELICKQLLELKDYSQVSELFENLEQVDGVRKVERLFWQRKMFFIFGILLTFSIWAAHPFVLHFLTMQSPDSRGINVLSPLDYVGLLMLFLLVFMLKGLTHRSFPELRETSVFWAVTFLLGAFAVITVLAEIYFFHLNFNILIVGISILLIFSFLTYEYLTYRRLLKKRTPVP
jgi:(p)ppGpp synthase/HD superfamily hydrolase